MSSDSNQTDLTGTFKMSAGTGKNNTPIDYPMQIAREVDHLSKTTGIDLDPCASDDSNLATVNVRNEGGLQYDWTEFETAFVNHPYALGEPGRWLGHVREVAPEMSCIVTLSKGDPSTDWFEDHMTEADLLCFPHHRIAFVGEDSGAKFPNVFGVFGTVPEGLEALFDRWGWTPREW